MENRFISLHTGISHDQFIQLAHREPDYCIERYNYRLDVTELGDGPHTYPVFKVGPTHTILFQTFSCANNHMKELCKQMKVYRSRITQIPTFDSKEKRGSQWLFDGDGNLADCTIVQKSGIPEETTFFGRPLEKQRFFPGNIAELMLDDKVCLVSVFSPIATPEDCWKVYIEDPNGYDVNFTADSHYVLSADYSEDSLAIITALMKPRYPVPKEIQDKLKARFNDQLEIESKGDCPNIVMIPILDDNAEEVWYDFTFGNPAYPKEFEKYLREDERCIAIYADPLYELIPVESHWLVKEILRDDELQMMDEDSYYREIEAILCHHPEIEDFEATNKILFPIMRNENVDDKLKSTLWQAKVSLDLSIINYRQVYSGEKFCIR